MKSRQPKIKSNTRKIKRKLIQKMNKKPKTTNRKIKTIPKIEKKKNRKYLTKCWPIGKKTP